MRTFCISLFGSINLYNIYGKHLNKVSDSTKSKKLEVEARIYSKRFSGKNRRNVSNIALSTIIRTDHNNTLLPSWLIIAIKRRFHHIRTIIRKAIVLQYEKGTRKISIEKLYSIAKVLSISVTDLIPVSNEKICLEDEGEEILNLIRKYKTINDKELRRMFCLLTKIARVGEENSKKTERIKIAKGLVKEGISIDIVSKTIGLSANECVEEKTDSVYYQIGKKIKEWKRVYSKGFSRENDYNP